MDNLQPKPDDWPDAPPKIEPPNGDAACVPPEGAPKEPKPDGALFASED